MCIRDRLGLGLTALLASFMSGMAGNVTAFNTVWTFDIYQSYIRPHQSDAHYLWVGRMATVFGVLWKRTTGHGAFWGLVLGTAATALHYELTDVAGAASLLPKMAIGHTYPSDMAQNFWGAIVAWTTCFVVTAAISLM